ncbi:MULTISPECIES: Imm42 family immunity protein [unclassified Nodularia (in: cyanobacteria)]|uniref:Imm42 family immunity protein n=1 Tax=unclassified Nodularia (in: cyanobacteria) TaxID=2656917 RepID=UPI00187E73E1|nr:MULTISPECIES: Imm42 family immunity protein [unclassified Nodularia (in: cyanobacteria)]MBE9201092.1 hypothetical protein [Nodularia sp. LEGE 06071]MCC2694837.1 hypothetical protein [Nodularia sp. LEGE 04288]
MLFGVKQELALECLLDQIESDPQDYLLGNIVLWAGGFVIGDFSQTVILDLPYSNFKISLTECGKRQDSNLMKMTPGEVWEFLNSAIYGDNSDDNMASYSHLAKREQKYRKFCICPGFSEAFDGEIAFLIEGEEEERFIWKELVSQTIKEVRLKPQTYKYIIESFTAWYSHLIVTIKSSRPVSN